MMKDIQVDSTADARELAEEMQERLRDVVLRLPYREAQGFLSGVLAWCAAEERALARNLTEANARMLAEWPETWGTLPLALRAVEA